MHLGVVLACLAQYVKHLANRVLCSFGPFHDTHHGFVARLALLEVFAGNEDVVCQGAVLCQEIGIALLHLERSHEGLLAAAQYVGDGGFADVVLATGKERDLHEVAVHRVEAVALGHEDGFAAFLGLEGVLAVGLAVERAGHHLRGGVQGVVAARLFLDEVVHLQAFQHIHEEHLGRRGVQVELLADGLQGEQDVGVLLKEINHCAFQIALSQSSTAGLLLSHNANVLGKVTKKM